MIVWSAIEANCPMCQRRLRVREVGGGFITGQDSDLLVRMKGNHLIQAEIHTCPACRFSGYAAEFTTRSISGCMVKRFFADCAHRLRDDGTGAALGAPHGSRTPLPHVQYYWSALASPAIGLSATEAGLRMARAYWCLRLQPSCRLPEKTLKQLGKRYLREAISRLRQGLRHESDRGPLIYLIAELCRRNTNFLLAKRYFERYLEGERGPGYLREAASRLLRSAVERDAAAKSMEEVLYGSERRGRRMDRRRGR